MLNKSNIDPEEAIGDRLGFVKTFSIYINCVYSKEVRRGWGEGGRGGGGEGGVQRSAEFTETFLLS